MIVVVGAGISGIACARVLHDAGQHVELVERSDRCGGRMASPLVGGRRVDMGAAYFTARDAAFVEVVRRWTDRGLLRVWTDTLHAVGPEGVWTEAPGPVRYAAPGGLAGLVADLAEGLSIHYGRTVSRVSPGPFVNGHAAQAVVLAMPDPQAHALLDPALAGAVQAASGPGWNPALAFAAEFPERSWRPFDAVFVNDNPVLTLVADDGRRRGDDAPVLVAHASADHTRRFLDEPVRAVAGILDALADLLGPVGEPPGQHLQLWPAASPGQERDRPFHLDDAGVALAGDGWGSPRIETAWRSGTLLGQALLDRFS